MALVSFSYLLAQKDVLAKVINAKVVFTGTNVNLSQLQVITSDDSTYSCCKRKALRVSASTLT
jgi:hypothetical protein